MFFDGNTQTDLACENSKNDRKHKMEKFFSEMGTEIIKTTFDPLSENGLLPRDAYYGIQCGAIWELKEEKAYCTSLLTASKIKKLLESTVSTDGAPTVLVVGLGNRNITADALGPLCADRTLVRPIGDKQKPRVYILAPGVEGQTGINTTSLVKIVANSVKADAVIAVDSLKASRPERLGTFIQIGNCGIEPGAGIEKRGDGISYSSIGVPVISIGIPTVIGYSDFSQSIKSKHTVDQIGMLVTAKECDIITDTGASILAKAINTALETF